jgi:hypothetical protein
MMMFPNAAVRGFIAEKGISASLLMAEGLKSGESGSEIVLDKILDIDE